ncbi:calcium-binding protein [Bauldia litoralis]|uniref:Hemolysin-type calcium-binding repeat-containing protein n=1 Tax=Bauldia litoralis TaxID=665467 RepID=A0A1G6AUR8_9HYPH|nr:hypothetical protein [Bauldia litoralis]SDB12115.1 Hemolysin-type calcium-binding repeat-containing protein [Bauldia litoralis]
MALALYGSEFHVSTEPGSGTGHEYAGAATGLANGGFALTYLNNSPTYSYFARVYDGFGASTAGPIGTGSVNGGATYLNGGIAELSNGRLVKAYSKIGPGVGDPIDVAVTSSLPDLTGSTPVATPGPLAPSYQPGYQYSPGVASSQLGGYMVVWDDDATSYGRPGKNVVAQVFNNAGVAVAPAFVASEALFSAGDQKAPNVDRLASGNYVIAWQDDSGIDGNGSGIRARVFSSAGAVVTGEKAVNQGTTGNQTTPAVAGLVGGGFVVVWEDAGRIEARLFSAAGTALTGDLTVAQVAAGNKYFPDVTGLLDGGFLVTWTTDANAANGGDGSSLSIKARAFSASGAATSNEILVNSVTSGGQCHSTAATLADGRVVISWTDESNALLTNHETRAQLLDPRTKGVTVTGTSGADKYVGSAFADVLKGMGGNDELRAGAGNDTLDGGTGADQLRGGPGNDTYVVDNAGDVIDEANGGSGVDTVRATISFSLANAVHVKGSVEKLVLTGSAKINGTGNALANTLVGNAAANTLDGGPGDDIISGGPGKDKLVGRDGNDTFVFADALIAGNADKVVGFKHNKDKFLLDAAVFAEIGPTLGRKEFVEATKAKDGNDHIIRSGKELYYDADGKGGDKQVLVAIVGKKAVIDHHDFVVGDFVI